MPIAQLTIAKRTLDDMIDRGHTKIDIAAIFGIISPRNLGPMSSGPTGNTFVMTNAAPQEEKMPVV